MDSDVACVGEAEGDEVCEVTEEGPPEPVEVAEEALAFGHGQEEGRGEDPQAGNACEEGTRKVDAAVVVVVALSSVDSSTVFIAFVQVGVVVVAMFVG